MYTCHLITPFVVVLVLGLTYIGPNARTTTLETIFIRLLLIFITTYVINQLVDMYCNK